MRTRIAVVLAVAATLAVLGLARAEDPPRPFIPGEKDLAKLVLEVAKAYPTDGTHRYHWPRGSSWTGTTRDLLYDGVRVCDGDPEKRCYCCGLTFEVFFRAWELAAKKAKVAFKIGALDAKGVDGLRRDWFGRDANDRKTLQRALVEHDLGRAIALEEARPGDFVQLWRADKTGHSVVLLDLERDASGKLVALRYWSTQKSTNGVGERVERLDGPRAVLAAETYVARAGKAASRAFR